MWGWVIFILICLGPTIVMAGDYYEILGVSQYADHDTIRKAHRQLVREFHPDQNGGNSETLEKFKQVQEAWEILGDPEKRASYDQLGQLTGNSRNRNGYFYSVEELKYAYSNHFVRDRFVTHEDILSLLQTRLKKLSSKEQAVFREWAEYIGIEFQNRRKKYAEHTETLLRRVRRGFSVKGAADTLTESLEDMSGKQTGHLMSALISDIIELRTFIEKSAAALRESAVFEIRGSSYRDITPDEMIRANRKLLAFGPDVSSIEELVHRHAVDSWIDIFLNNMQGELHEKQWTELSGLYTSFSPNERNLLNKLAEPHYTPDAKARMTLIWLKRQEGAYQPKLDDPDFDWRRDAADRLGLSSTLLEPGYFKELCQRATTEFEVGVIAQYGLSFLSPRQKAVSMVRALAKRKDLSPEARKMADTVLRENRIKPWLERARDILRSLVGRICRKA